MRPLRVLVTIGGTLICAEVKKRWRGKQVLISFLCLKNINTQNQPWGSLHVASHFNFHFVLKSNDESKGHVCLDSSYLVQVLDILGHSKYGLDIFLLQLVGHVSHRGIVLLGHSAKHSYLHRHKWLLSTLLYSQIHKQKHSAPHTQADTNKCSGPHSYVHLPCIPTFLLG